MQQAAVCHMKLPSCMQSRPKSGHTVPRNTHALPHASAAGPCARNEAAAAIEWGFGCLPCLSLACAGAAGPCTPAVPAGVGLRGLSSSGAHVCALAELRAGPVAAVPARVRAPRGAFEAGCAAAGAPGGYREACERAVGDVCSSVSKTSVRPFKIVRSLQGAQRSTMRK